jgi:methanogenic corrinoid protein MtbC1
MANERLFEEMTDAVVAGLPDKARELANEALRAGVDPMAAIEQGFKPGMDVVGEGFAKGEFFIPDLPPWSQR